MIVSNTPAVSSFVSFLMILIIGHGKLFFKGLVYQYWQAAILSIYFMLCYKQNRKKFALERETLLAVYGISLSKHRSIGLIENTETLATWEE